ncbi:hypothetical protein [Microbacterium sp. zg.Y909]|uniref:hypothetical protein n=1 Tax=Microbacterium sp. zg.Y909 TaxID=2969413 RepID=UPI00214B287E|nr:hypothetical protein [Microbacterium sp. zg.Y909]MCR2826610.1 hypothetical protein [Microbacterium sp. zg.Y909]
MVKRSYYERADNLANLCPGRHHPVKHGTGWSVVQKADGILEWTSPTGRVYTDIPRRVLEFMAIAAIDEPAPFQGVASRSPPADRALRGA